MHAWRNHCWNSVQVSYSIIQTLMESSDNRIRSLSIYKLINVYFVLFVWRVREGAFATVDFTLNKLLHYTWYNNLLIPSTNYNPELQPDHK